MKTYFDEVNDRKNACQTIEDWQKFAEWLIDEIYERNSSDLSMQEAILTKYGEKGLDELMEIAADIEKKYLPAEMTMHAFGYRKDSMCPISNELALKYLEDGREVYLLFNDNTEKMIANTREIENHNGLFGITYDELERVAKDLQAER